MNRPWTRPRYVGGVLLASAWLERDRAQHVGFRLDIHESWYLLESPSVEWHDLAPLALPDAPDDDYRAAAVERGGGQYRIAVRR